MPKGPCKPHGVPMEDDAHECDIIEGLHREYC